MRQPEVLERTVGAEVPPAATGLAVGYLVNCFPALSHTFIFREIAGLRALGFRIEVCSICPPDRADADMPADEAEQRRRVYYVKPAGVSGAIQSHAPFLLGHPALYFRGLAAALRMAGLDLRRLLYHFFYFVEAVMVGRWMERHGLKHLHVHFGSSVATVALLVSKIFPVRFSMTMHGPDELYDAARMALREKVAGARFAICISDFARSQLMLLSDPRHWDKLRVVRLGVDPAEFRPAAIRPYPHPFRILCVSRCAPAKGLDVLLAAVRDLIDEGRDVELQIAGDGPEKARLEEKAAALAGHVSFLGPQRRTAIAGLLGSADAFALASFAEGIPVSLMEAMAAGVPCVSTTVAGIPELIRDGMDGLLVPAGNVSELRNALRRLMVDAGLRARLARNAGQKILEQYNLPVNLRALADVFEEHLRDDIAESRPERDRRFLPDA